MKQQPKNRDLRNKMGVVVVVIGIDVQCPKGTESLQCAVHIPAVNVDEITRCPHFNADQHDVDAL